MKVIVNARFLTQPYTGVQQYAYKLSCFLKKNSPYEVEFIAPDDILQVEHAKFLKPTVYGKKTGPYWEQFELPKYLSKNHNPLLINFGNTAPLKYKNQIITIHDLSTFKFPQWFSYLYGKYYQILLPRIAKTSKKIITVSEFSKKEIVETFRLNPDKVNVIYNSIEVENKIKTTDKKYILSIGSNSGRKNFSNLILAYHHSAVEEYELWIRADKNDIFKEDKKLQDVLFLNKKIKFIERKSNEEYHELIKNASLLVNISLYEGFGMPNLEALAVGTPILCSDIPVFREVCNGQAMYVNPNHPTLIAEKIKQVLYEQPFDKELLIARAKEFDIEKEGFKLLELIHKTT